MVGVLGVLGCLAGAIQAEGGAPDAARDVEMSLLDAPTGLLPDPAVGLEEDGTASRVSVSELEVTPVSAAPPRPVYRVEPKLGVDSPVLENARQRSRLLQKLNPMASDLIGAGNVAAVGVPDRDSEGSEFHGGYGDSRVFDSFQPSVLVDSYIQFNAEREALMPGGSVVHWGRVGDQKPFGYRLRFTSDAGPNLFDQIFMRWRQIPSGDQAGTFYPSQFRYDRRPVDARSLVLAVDTDWRLSEHHRVHLRGGWTEVSIDSSRGAVEFRANPGGLDVASMTDEEVRFENSRIIRSLLHEPELRSKAGGALGGEIRKGDWFWKYGGAAGMWKRERLDMARAEFEQRGADVTFRVPASDRYFPEVLLGESVRLDDPTAFRFREVAREENVTEDRDWALGMSGRRDFVGRWGDANLRLGAIHRDKQRANRHDRWIYDAYDGDLTLDRWAHAHPAGRIIHDRYPLGFTPDPVRTLRYLADNEESFRLNEDASRLDSDPSRYVANEAVLGVFLGGEWRGERTWGRAGSRAEWTRTDTVGNQVLTDEAGRFLSTEEVSASLDYINLMPSVEAGWQILPWWQVRGGYFHSIARPSYYDLVPYQKVNRLSLSLEAGNPNLRAVTYDNFVLGFDYDLGRVGRVSTGVTRKEVEGFLYRATSILGSGEFEGFEANRPDNGNRGGAWLYEVAWRWEQPVSLLGGGQLGFLVSYTHADSRGEVGIRAGESIPLPEVSRHLLRWEVTGSVGRWRTRLGLSYQDDSLSQVASVIDYDRYLAPRLDVAVGAGYQIGRQAALTVDVFNLTDTADRFYEGGGLRPTKNEYNSWRLKVGAQVVF